MHDIGKTSIRSAKQCRRPTIVCIAHTSEPMHGNHLVNVLDKALQSG
jgi:hypothetical protein